MGNEYAKLDNVIRDLEQRFNSSRPEYYNRRIIVWHDEERDYADSLDEVKDAFDDVIVAEISENNLFAVKKLILKDYPESDILLYCPVKYKSLEDDWLLNVKLYSEEYCSDWCSVLATELNLPSGGEMKSKIKYYRKFFGNQDRQSKFKSLSGYVKNGTCFDRAVMAVLCGVRSIQPGDIVAGVLSAGLAADANGIYKDIVRYGVEDAFWEMARAEFGYRDEGIGSLEHLAYHVFVSALTCTINPGHLTDLESFVSDSYKSSCYDLLNAWQGRDSQGYFSFARDIEERLDIKSRFSHLDIKTISDTWIFPCINECILDELITEITEERADTAFVRQTRERRRAAAFYGDYEHFFDAIYYITYIYEFHTRYHDGFHQLDPEIAWKNYTDEQYKMDMYYRYFLLSFDKCVVDCQNRSMYDMEERMKTVAKLVEKYYKKFLTDLSDNWINACGDRLRDDGYVMMKKQARQKSFYSTYVQRQAGSKVYVIISDALRYDVAVSLKELLEKKTTSCEVKLDSMESIFPTATKYGMAALLPSDKLSVSVSGGNLEVLADGMRTDSTNREKVLKSENPKSVVIKYSKPSNIDGDKMKEAVQGNEVIYIYHNLIDEAGHHDEDDIFNECEKAISDIGNLVSYLINYLNAYYIFITADHGFLYTHEPLEEDSKVDKSVPSDMDIECEHRYIITEKGAEAPYLVPVKFFDDRYSAFATRELVRIKKQGGVGGYVHGGISLQEMVVPVISCHYVRPGSRRYMNSRDTIETRPVTIELITPVKKTSNTIVPLEFYQKEAVGGNVVACMYQVYFADSEGKVISEVQKIIADKTDTDNTKRHFRCRLVINRRAYDSAARYFLWIKEENSHREPQKIPFEINLYGTDDFGF